MELSSIRWDMILGGLGLFLFGIQFMGNGLKAFAGDKLRDYINKYTANRFSAVMIGILLTVLMQSSSASTAITIGLVRAGLMTLNQAAGIVMGANIGTTITSFLISLNIDKYSLYIVFVGTMLICFSKRHKIKYLGEVILGFGLIFFGLSAMGDTLAALKDLPEFSAFALKMSDNAMLSMVTGAGMTAVVQSSAATIGVVQKLYNAGAISFMACLPFMFGANIGTTITGILAALSGAKGAKRTACLHTMFNVFATIIGMVILHPYAAFVEKLRVTMNLNPMMELAVANIIFKTAATLVFLPFLDKMCAIACKIIPGKEPERPEVNIDELDADVGTILPSAALSASVNAIDQMANVVRQDIAETRDFLNKPGTSDDKDLLAQTEALLNSMDDKITSYLVKVSLNSNLTPRDISDIRLNLEVIKNLERVGDLATNVVEFLEMVFEDNGTFTEDAHRDVNTMFDLLMHMLNRSMEIFHTRDASLYASLMEDENALDDMEFKARQEHFDRMAHTQCSSAVAASVYCDLLGNLERMGDHCLNIAKSAILAENDS